MARRTKFDAVADAKKAKADAEQKLKDALSDLTHELGDRLQQLFGSEEAHHAVVALEEGLKSTKKGERLQALTSRVAPPAKPSSDSKDGSNSGEVTTSSS